jgi:predicted nucleic acid-binding protein
VIVLDTNVVSEIIARSPSQKVLEWLRLQRRDRIYTTTITEAEILTGVAVLPQGKRRTELEGATGVLFESHFASRILPFDSAAARIYPRVVATRRRLGRPVTALDAQIAAICAANGAALATRNIRDFDGCGLQLIDPWL